MSCTDARRPTWTLTTPLALSLLLLGCAAAPPPPAVAFASARPAGSLDVRLHFGEGADLDLFVTDPRKEAVYFGNTPSIGGGVLDADRRCDAPAPRVETVRFATPRPGVYRVGVSYDRACGFRREAVPFRVEIEADGLALEHEGRVSPGRFDTVVLEFALPEAPATPDPESPRDRLTP